MGRNDEAADTWAERPVFFPDIAPADLAVLKAEWLDQLSALAADPPRFLVRADLASLLYRWRDYEGSGRPRVRYRCVGVHEPRHLAGLWGQGRGKDDTFRRDTVDEMIGVGEARRRFAEVDRAALSEDLRHPLDVLGRHLDRWTDGTADD